MRQFYLGWTHEVAILSQPVRELDGINLPQAVREIPWGHNIELLSKVKSPAERLWYAQQASANGWSRSMLLHWIDSDLHSRQGKAVTNFKTTLPALQSDLANQLIKDPYTFDFLTLGTDAAERELKEGLLSHIRKFLLELGAGFAFVGQQVHLEVDGEDFVLDLLFYHLPPEEEQTLKTLVESGSTVARIAGQLGRNRGAIRNRIVRLGIENLLSPKERERLRRNFNPEEHAGGME